MPRARPRYLPTAVLNRAGPLVRLMSLTQGCGTGIMIICETLQAAAVLSMSKAQLQMWLTALSSQILVSDKLTAELAVFKLHFCIAAVSGGAVQVELTSDKLLMSYSTFTNNVATSTTIFSRRDCD